MRATVFLLIIATTFGALACEREPTPFEAYLKMAEEEIGRKQYEKADDALSKALKSSSLEDQKRNRNLVPLLMRLGYGYRVTRKDPNRALPIFETALSIAAQSPQEQWTRGDIQLMIADTHTDLGEYSKAETLMREVLSRRERFPANAEDIRVVLGNLAEVCDKQGKYDEAERLYLREIGIMEANVKENALYKAGIAYPLANLAEIYRKQGRSDDADRHFERSLAVMADARLENSAVPETMENYARLLRQTGRAQEAERLESEAKARRVRLGAADK